MLWLAAGKDMGPYITWIGVMMGALVAVTVVLLIVRSKLLAKETADAGAGMMDELRALRDRGEITPEEYEAARAAMIARMRSRGSGKGSADRTGKSPDR